jgi:hypothetical protein
MPATALRSSWSSWRTASGRSLFAAVESAHTGQSVDVPDFLARHLAAEQA